MSLTATQESTNLLQEKLNGGVMQTAGESPAFTEAQMTAGRPTTEMTSTPDRCASVNLPGSRVEGRGEGEGNILALFDGAIGKPPDDWRVEEANKRLKILETFDELLGQGLSKADAVKKLGVGYATIWRWRGRFAKRGFNGLLPETEACGRHSWLRKLNLTPEELKFLMQRCQGINLDTDSITTSLRVFANSNECPARLAEVILDPNRCSKHAIPRSIRDAAKVAKPVKDAHRGPRRLSLKGIYIPRKMDVLPGDMFTADDTTPIYAWWVPWRQSDEYPFGVKLLQGQFIPVMDVASQCVITYVMIAREKGSYRAADIWALFGHTFDEVGLPRLGFQLERGSWEANIIRGQEISYEVDEVSLSRRLGGLRQLPTNPHDRVPDGFVWPKTLETFPSFLPKSKSIEAWFNRHQTLEGTLWGSLGRDQMRKPFERAKKLFQACQRGAEDPRNHFLSGEEMSKRLRASIDYLNNEPMEGEVFKGVPRAKFEAAVSERPLFQFRGVPEMEELRWLYRRDWTAGPKGNPLCITNGWARVRLTHHISGERYSLFYTNPAVFAQHEGEQIAVYYDRENFTEPAQIILARTGEYLCEAEYCDRVGSFLDTDRSGIEVAKAWRNAVMSIYGTLVKYAPSRELPQEIAQRRAEAKNGAHGVTRPTIVDGRPAAEPVQRRGMIITAPTPEERQRNREELSRQAALANQLRALQGDE